MKPERWRQLDEVFHAALDVSVSERAAFLDEACAGDELLLKQVEALLVAHEQAGSFIEKPALEAAAHSLAGEGAEEAAIRVGQSISHYRIVAPLGAGAMGEVYLAQDAQLGRKVALKLLPGSFTEDVSRLRRFEQEARVASALNHPNIVTVHEIGHAGSAHFIVTEFIDGVTLRRQMESRRLELDEVLDIAIQAASALVAAHSKGIVHRDIKPENIMVQKESYGGRENHIKVLDFGIAKLADRSTFTTAPDLTTKMLVRTEEGVVIGTAHYMSPEQVRGDTVDLRTDIWSLGVLIYEMVAGQLPFEGSSSSEMMASLLSEKEPQPLARYSREVPAELERIVSKALRKEREQRYQTTKDLLLDLQSLKQQLDFEAKLERSMPPEPKRGPGTISLASRALSGEAATTTHITESRSIKLRSWLL
jgi:serine/threonine protein kinase